MRGVEISGNYAFTAGDYMGLQVVDISDPENPRSAGGSTLEGYAQAVAVAGHYAYVGSRPDGFHVFDISNPSKPRRVGSHSTGDWARAIAVSGDYAYVATFFGGVLVFDASTPAAPRIAGTMADVRSWDIRISGQLAYFAEDASLRIFDLSNPAMPKPVGSCTTLEGSSGIALSGNYAYLAARGFLEVVDISNPAEPRSVGECPGPWWGGQVIARGDHVFLAGANRGLHVIDVSDPANPRLAASRPPVYDCIGIAARGNHVFTGANHFGLQAFNVSDPADPRRAGGLAGNDFIYSAAVSGHYAYLASDLGGLHVLDVTDPAIPRRVGGCSTAGLARAVAVSGSYAFVGGETTMRDTNVLEGAFQVIDISQPAKPQIVATLPDLSVKGLALAGTNAFVAAGAMGLQILSVTDPLNPRRLGGIETIGSAQAVTVSGNYAYVSGSSLSVIDTSDPAKPFRVAEVPGAAQGVAVSGGFAYVSASGLQVLDISQPAFPRKVGLPYRVKGYPRGARIAENLLYLTAVDSSVYGIGFYVFDIGDPGKLRQVGCFGVGDNMYDVALADGCAYVAGGDLKVVGISKRVNPLRVATTNRLARALGASGTLVYLCGSKGLEIIDVSDPARPRQTGTYSLNGVEVKSVALSGSLAFLAAGSELHVVDVSNPADPRREAVYPTHGVAQSVVTSGQRAYVIDEGVWDGKSLRWGRIEDTRHFRPDESKSCRCLRHQKLEIRASDLDQLHLRA